jgi:hypothetical protein
MIDSLYNKIIGLSRTQHSCLPALTSEQLASDSGLYITDLVQLESLLNVENLANSDAGLDLWDTMVMSRTQAASTFVAESNALMMTKVRAKLPGFNGLIGDSVGKGTIESDGHTYQGVHILCNPIEGAIITIKSIEIVFESYDTPVDLYIVNKRNKEVFISLDNVLVGGRKTIPVNISLPTFDAFGSAEYWILYKHEGGNVAYNNKIGCGCNGFVPYFDKASPHFGRNYVKGNAWGNWIMVQGVKMTQEIGNVWDMAEFDDLTSKVLVDNAALGLSIDISVGCRIDSLMAESLKDYMVNPIAMSIAKAVQLKAAEQFSTLILTSQRLSRPILINHEQIAEMRAEWRIQYNEILDYITSNIQIEGSDCFNCRPLLDMRINSILS